MTFFNHILLRCEANAKQEALNKTHLSKWTIYPEPESRGSMLSHEPTKGKANVSAIQCLCDSASIPEPTARIHGFACQLLFLYKICSVQKNAIKGLRDAVLLPCHFVNVTSAQKIRITFIAMYHGFTYKEFENVPNMSHCHLSYSHLAEEQRRWIQRIIEHNTLILCLLL